METRDWACLLPDVLDLILYKLVDLSDHVRFGSVCKAWLVVATHEMQKLHRLKTSNKQVPLLLIPTLDNNQEWRSLYSLNQTKQHLFEFKLHVPYNRRCCGSSHGWLIFAERDYSITLFNPFTAANIHLPQVNKTFYTYPGSHEPEEVDYDGRPHTDEEHLLLYPYHAKKIILSCDPYLYPDSFQAVAIFGEVDTLFFFKAGTESWQRIPWQNTPILDLTFYKGVVYATSVGRAVSVDISKPDLKIKRLTSDFVFNPWRKTYVVESSWGELLFVNRNYESREDGIHLMTTKFQVYKLRPDNNMVEMIETLGHDAIFIGDNHSMSVSTLDFPGECEPNSIYYTDDCTDYLDFYEPYGPSDIGVFNMEDQTIRPHYAPNIAQKHMPPPIWIVPTFNGRKLQHI